MSALEEEREKLDVGMEGKKEAEQSISDSQDPDQTESHLPTMLESPSKTVQRVMSDSEEPVPSDEETSEHLPGMLASPMPNRQDSGVTTSVKASETLRTPVRSGAQAIIASNPATPCLISGSVPGTPGTPDIPSISNPKDTPKSAYRSEIADEVHPLPSGLPRFNRLMQRDEIEEEPASIVASVPSSLETLGGVFKHEPLKTRSMSLRSTTLTERSEASTMDLPPGIARSNTERSLSRSNTERSVSHSAFGRSNTDASLTRSNTDRTGLTISGSVARSGTEQSLVMSAGGAEMSPHAQSKLQRHSPREWLVQGAGGGGESYHSLPDKLNDSLLSGAGGAYRTSEERLGVMARLCRRQALLPGGALDKRLHDMALAVGGTGATGAFFTSRPVSAALAKWPWRLFLLLLAAGSAALTAAFLPDLDRIRSGGPFFCFVPLQLRNGTVLPAPDKAGGAGCREGCVAELRLLLNGCVVPGAREAERKGGVLHVAFEAPVEFNGYEIVTGDGEPGADPVMYEIWESGEGPEGPWEVASFAECKESVPEGRGAVKRVDWREGWRERWVVTVLSYALGTVLFLAGSVLAMWNRCGEAKGALGLALLLVCSGYLASLARTPLSVCAWEGSAPVWAVAFLLSIALWLALVASVLAESHHNLVLLMGFGGALSVTKLIELVESLYYEGSFWEKHWGARSPLALYFFVAAGVAFFFFPALIMMCHLRVLRKSSQLMQPDREEYDRCWQEVTGMEMNRRLLASVEEAAQRIAGNSSRAGHPLVRQMNRSRVEGEPQREWDILCGPGGGAGAGGATWSGNNSPWNVAASALQRTESGSRSSWLTGRWRRVKQPVKSLDQLYCQAALMHPVLKHKVSGWAAQAAGLFPIKGGSPRRSLSRGSRSLSLTQELSPKVQDESTMAPLESPMGPPAHGLMSPGLAARSLKAAAGGDAEPEAPAEARRLVWDEAEEAGAAEGGGDAGEREAGESGAGVLAGSGSAGYGSGLSGLSGGLSSVGSASQSLLGSTRQLSVRRGSAAGASGGGWGSGEEGGSEEAGQGAAAGRWRRPDLQRARSERVHRALDKPPSAGRRGPPGRAGGLELHSLPARPGEGGGQQGALSAVEGAAEGSRGEEGSMLQIGLRRGGQAGAVNLGGAEGAGEAEGGEVGGGLERLVHGRAFGEGGGGASGGSHSPASQISVDLELEAAVRGGSGPEEDTEETEEVSVIGKAFGGWVQGTGGVAEEDEELEEAVGARARETAAAERREGIREVRRLIEDMVDAATGEGEREGGEGTAVVSSQLVVGEDGEGGAGCNFTGSKFGHAHTIQGDESMVKWTDLKSPDRSVEKAVRVYKGDVSQLVDICRQCIIFENLADLLVCLETIEQDPEVAVERIKNRLSPAYDPKLSAGYRDVALNIRIVNAETLGMGIETHISEVQLILLPFYELKTNEGHKRYVAFRNLRAE